MLDINFIVKNKEKLQYAAKHKGVEFDFDQFIQIYKDKKELIHKINFFRQEKNKLAKLHSSEDKENIEYAKIIRSQIKDLEDHYRKLEIAYMHYSYRVPNIFLEGTPIGKTNLDNQEIKKWGDVPQFGFKPKSILEIGAELDIIDISRGVKIAGQKQYFLKGDAVLLEQAIFQFVLHFLRKEGFNVYSVPLMVKKDALYATGYFPEAEEETYFLEKDDLFLIGTAEVSICAYYKDDILKESDLPIKVCALSNCFRREAGTYGRAEQGLYRIHQFQKIEQVIFCENDPEISEKLHYYLLNNAEFILQALKLPYRIVRVCSGDLGFGQVLKHDIETWMPSKNTYAETHSCSSFYDFQTRRLNMRYYNSKTKKNEYPFSLNNTAIASPRILIPLLENHQQKDGRILIPEVLRPYMGSRKYLNEK